MDTKPLQNAIRIAGGQKALANAIAAHVGRPFTQQAVSYWLKNGTPIAAEYLRAIESVTNGAVSRHDLRPDLYPRESAA